MHSHHRFSNTASQARRRVHAGMALKAAPGPVTLLLLLLKQAESMTKHSRVGSKGIRTGADLTGLHAGLAPKGSPVRYIVVDQAERLVDTALPGVLLRLHELSGTTHAAVYGLL